MNTDHTCKTRDGHRIAEGLPVFDYNLEATRVIGIGFIDGYPARCDGYSGGGATGSCWWTLENGQHQDGSRLLTGMTTPDCGYVRAIDSV